MAWIDPSDVSAGSVLTASVWNQDVVANTTALARGYITASSKTGSQNVTTAADLTDLSLSVSQVAGRAYLYFITVEAISTVAGDVWVLELTDSTPTTLQRATGRLSAANVSETITLVFVEVAASTATVTRKARGQRATGSGTFTFGGASGRPAQIMAIDLGDPA